MSVGLNANELLNETPQTFAEASVKAVNMKHSAVLVGGSPFVTSQKVL